MSAMARKNIGGREVLLEFHQVGDYVRVAAIDPVSNVEVTMVGASGTSEQDLTRLAVRKLEYVMRKRARADTAASASPSRGIKV